MIYVVDDDESVCRALERLLRSAELGVATFTSANNPLPHSLAQRFPVLVIAETGSDTAVVHSAGEILIIME